MKHFIPANLPANVMNNYYTLVYSFDEYVVLIIVWFCKYSRRPFVPAPWHEKGWHTNEKKCVHKHTQTIGTIFMEIGPFLNSHLYRCSSPPSMRKVGTQTKKMCTQTICTLVSRKWDGEVCMSPDPHWPTFVFLAVTLAVIVQKRKKCVDKHTRTISTIFVENSPPL